MTPSGTLNTKAQSLMESCSANPADAKLLNNLNELKRNQSYKGEFTPKEVQGRVHHSVTRTVKIIS